MKKVLLSAEALCKSFAHNGGQVHVLSNIDLELYDGDFTVVMGAFGSGKSTLLYTLSGMDRATSGKVIYHEEDIAAMGEQRLAKLRRGDFGFIFQQMHLVSNLSLYENIVVPGWLNKEQRPAQVKEHAEELIEQMGISHIKSHLPSQVSGGEQQRCAIARAIINGPRLLFADEPTGALNRKNTTEVLNLLTCLNQAGQSILMVTHDIRAALRATRLLYLEDGKIVGDMALPEYQPDRERNREEQVNAWLSSMEW